MCSDCSQILQESCRISRKLRASWHKKDRKAPKFPSCGDAVSKFNPFLHRIGLTGRKSLLYNQYVNSVIQPDASEEVSEIKQQAIYQKNQKITALYCRLSRDDSSSILTQKAMLSRYASDHGYRNTRFFVDDGYSGTNFNRPAFKKMIAEVEAGHVERVITKDLSRLGRNYLGAIAIAAYSYMALIPLIQPPIRS